MAFLRGQDGAVTVDWVVLCAAATGLAFAMLEMGQWSLGDYSAQVRNEVQASHFVTNWTP